MANQYPFAFNLLVLASSLLFFTYWLARVIVFFHRVAIYTRKFLRDTTEALDDDKISPAVHGYPDQGNGIYSEHLSFDTWFKFNSSQRIHHNYTEWMPIFQVCCWICFLAFPTTAAYFAV